MIISRNFKDKLFTSRKLVYEIEEVYNYHFFDLINKIDENYTVVDFCFPCKDDVYLDTQLQINIRRNNIEFSSRRLILADLQAYDLYDEATMNKYRGYEFKKPAIGDIFISIVSKKETVFKENMDLYGIKRLCKRILSKPEVTDNKRYATSVFDIYKREKVEIPTGYEFDGFRPPKQGELYLNMYTRNIMHCNSAEVLVPFIIVKQITS